jgi:hypothetical protein
MATGDGRCIVTAYKRGRRALVDGYLNIFPKYKKENYGYWIPELSPESTGLVYRNERCLEARQIYCQCYEQAVINHEAFLRLKIAKQTGYNLNIIGYASGRPIEDDYNDLSRPFGHELILYTMLAIPEKEWPWRKG